MKSKTLTGIIIISLAFSLISCGDKDVAGRRSADELTAQVYSVGEITGKYNTVVQYGDSTPYPNELILFAASDNPSSDEVIGVYYFPGSMDVDGIITGTINDDGKFSGTWTEGYQDGPFGAQFSKAVDGKIKFEGNWRYSDNPGATYVWNGTETRGSKLTKEQIKSYTEEYDGFEGNQEDTQSDEESNDQSDEQAIDIELQDGGEVDDQPIKEDSDVMEFNLPDLLADKVTVKDGKQVYVYLENAGQVDVSSANGLKISVELLKADENVEEGTLAINIPYYLNASDLVDQKFLEAGYRAQYYLTDYSDIETGDSLRVCVDTDEIVYEGNEDNNCFKATLTEKDGGFTLEIEGM